MLYNIWNLYYTYTSFEILGDYTRNKKKKWKYKENFFNYKIIYTYIVNNYDFRLKLINLLKNKI